MLNKDAGISSLSSIITFSLFSPKNLELDSAQTNEFPISLVLLEDNDEDVESDDCNDLFFIFLSLNLNKPLSMEVEVSAIEIDNEALS